MPDASPEFKQLLRDAFAAIQIGQTYTFRRTFTDGDVSLFIGVTGDFNAYHIDDAFAAQTWFGRRNIPGLLTASMVRQTGQLTHSRGHTISRGPTGPDLVSHSRLPPSSGTLASRV